MATWWIDKPRLLGSSNPTDADLEQLRSDGFGVLVSLLREEEQAPGYDVERARVLGWVRHNIPVRDFCAPSVGQLDGFVKLVADLPPRAKAIVHCQGGIGRTGTFAAAYWIRRGKTVSEAIAHVRKARPNAVESPRQEAVLNDFARRPRAIIVRARAIDSFPRAALQKRSLKKGPPVADWLRLDGSWKRNEARQTHCGQRC